MAQKGLKTGSKRRQNDPKWCQNDAKLIPKWHQNDPGSTQKWSKITPQWWPYFGPNWTQNGSKSVETTYKMAPKGAKYGQKRSRSQADMFNSVQEHSKSTYGTTRHTQFTYNLIFVKCRFKGDTSETRFRSLCKMAFWAPTTGRISSCSCPFDLVPSRINSPKCPLQNRVLRFQYTFFWPKTTQNDRFLA